MEITKKRILVLILALSALAGTSLYFFLYQPLYKKITVKRAECRNLESQVAQARANVSLLTMQGRDVNFISPDEIAPAIEELTQRGRSKTVTFLSITPLPMENPDPFFQVLPIEMEVESSYRALGEFLGDLDSLAKCLVTIRGFEVIPLSQDEDKVRSKLIVNLHLRG